LFQCYQAHYILRSESKEYANFLARCEPITKGHFGGRRVINAWSTGADKFSGVFQADGKLTEMVKEACSAKGDQNRPP
jgi:hypothetical protein